MEFYLSLGIEQRFGGGGGVNSEGAYQEWYAGAIDCLSMTVLFGRGAITWCG